MRMCYPIQKLQKDKTVTPNRFIERLYRIEEPRQEYRESQQGSKVLRWNACDRPLFVTLAFAKKNADAFFLGPYGPHATGCAGNTWGKRVLFP